jgi:peptidoglycan/xylan/chitin deacetylase (PgdA/CDA1 family)
MLPQLTVRIEGPEFAREGQMHALATLADIAGFGLRWIEDGDAQLHYGPTSPQTGFWLPMDPCAWERLYRRERIDADLQERQYFGVPIHPLFVLPGSGDVDLPASLFFFLMLHDQWTLPERDQFKRFQAAASLLGRHEMLDVPVASRYGRALREGLRSAGFAVTGTGRFGACSAALCLTHDIDYISKFTPGLLFRETVRNLLFNRRRVSLHARVTRFREYLAFSQRERDPYVYSIHRMLELQRRYGMRATYLFKAGGTDKRDVTYNPRGARARGLMRRVREQGHDLGVHPSFNAYNDARMMEREVARIEESSALRPRSVRQHYLRFEYPVTWRLHEQCGLTVDSTLGFAEREGFRNGFCHPFRPFDIERNRPFDIWELPLTAMDGTLASYRSMDPEAARQRLRQLLDIVRAERGVAVLLFHNTVFDAHDFPGWGEVFEQTLGYAVECGDLLCASMQDIVREWVDRGPTRGESNEVKNPVPQGNT